MLPTGTLVPPAPSCTRCAGGWTLLQYEEVDSTSIVAGGLPAWHAVRATTQRAGRGRFSRSWVSDAGGLWLSAVVPLGEDPKQIQVLPLVAGLAAIEALRSLGLPGARLRWPNDLMVGGRKLAGVLVDSFAPKLAVVGIGINLTNQPAHHDPALRSTATRLADLLSSPPSADQLTELILLNLRTAAETLFTAGFSALSPRINQLWTGPRRVRVDLDAEVSTGHFAGVDASGCLLLEQDDGRRRVFAPHQVKLFREA